MNLLRYQRFRESFCFLFLLLYSTATVIAEPEQNPGIRNTIQRDYQYYFSRHRFLRMGIIFGGCALMANSSMDEDVQKWYQNHLCDSSADNMARGVKTIGEGRYLIPISLLAASTKYIFPSQGSVSLISHWGQLTARAYLLGGPAMLLMQRMTGASRPGERVDGSNWSPMKDKNGVSGHAFIGAVPFLTIACMNEDSALLKYLFYFLSALPAWSRVNDNKHYPSQAFLGWYMAWEATDAVRDSDKKERRFTFAPWFAPEIYCLSIGLSW